MTAFVSQVILKHESFLNEESKLYREELNFANPKETRCGEVILVANSKFVFVCTFCDRRFQSVVIFRSHIKGQHVKYTHNDSIKKDPLDFPPDKEEFQIKSSADLAKSHCNTQENFSDFMPVPDQHCNETFTDTKTQADNATKRDIKELGLTGGIQFQDTNAHAQGNSSNGTLFCRDIEDLLSEPMKVAIKKNRKKKVQPCSLCEHIARSKSSLQVHMFSQHGTGTRYQCEECGRFFRKASNLKSHLVIHSGTRPYKCEFCDSGFSHPNNLRTHRYIHTGERPHKCDQCEKGFVSSSGLKIHMREHTGERPYACQICEKKFANKCHFNRHIISHSNRRPFECSKCNKAFKHRETYNKHMVCHTNEKNEVCDICEKRFIHRKNLVQHKKIHSIVKQYTCTLCNKDFAQNAGLYSHMKFHKNKQ